MDAVTLLALIVVITTGQVASAAILGTRFLKLATLATRSAVAHTPQDLILIEREAARTSKIMKSREDPIYPIGI